MKKKEKPVEDERFETIYSQDDVDVLVDRKTGVNYMVYQCEHIIPLLDSDGKVLVTPVSHTVKGRSCKGETQYLT